MGGISFLKLSEISVPGADGYLLTFGPFFLMCMVPFSDFPDKYDHPNMGLVRLLPRVLTVYSY